MLRVVALEDLRVKGVRSGIVVAALGGVEVRPHTVVRGARRRLGLVPRNIRGRQKL